MEVVHLWQHLPHWLRAILLGSFIQFLFVALLRSLRGRYARIGPILDRFGPKKLRSPDARQRGGCLLITILWFALSWWVGHQAMRLRAWIVTWMLAK